MAIRTCSRSRLGSGLGFGNPNPNPNPKPNPNPNPNPNPKQLRSIDCWLPPALHGAADTELTLLLENTGGLAVELSIKYPTEMDLEIEHWADTGEPTAVELKQHLMVDKG